MNKKAYINLNVLASLVRNTEDLGNVIDGTGNGDAIRASNDGIINGHLGASAETAAKAIETSRTTFVQRLNKHAEATKAGYEDFQAQEEKVTASSNSLSLPPYTAGPLQNEPL